MLNHQTRATACASFLVALSTLGAGHASAAEFSRNVEREFTRSTQPLLKQFCLDCHSTEKQKGELDLERFTSLNEVKRDTKIWQHVIEQLTNGEMPPEDKPQPTPAQRQKLVTAIEAMLREIALASAGDPGPVLLRRLNNAEYTWTLRDLTGVPALDPAREFPADSAAGEGFLNTGNALVMSPALLAKYLDAAKAVAAHAVLLPDGIRFSPGTTRRDWTEETLAAIRALYGRYTVSGGAMPVNLQGIKFNTNDGGRLPLEDYLKATLELRRRGPQATAADFATVAAGHNLSPRYLRLLWEALNSDPPSPLLDPLRVRWRSAGDGDVPALADAITRWQGALWKFNAVGHIGKAGGPRRWMEPVDPLRETQEFRVPITASGPGDAVLYLSVNEAGDGVFGDVVVWQEPRLVAEGRPPVLLRDIGAFAAVFERVRQRTFDDAARHLAAAFAVHRQDGRFDTQTLAAAHKVDPQVLTAWLAYLGLLPSGELEIEHLTKPLANVAGYAFVQGWTLPGVADLSLVGNASGNKVNIPGDLEAHGIAVHPRPERWVAAGWMSPVDGEVSVTARVHHAHDACGNGVAWSVQVWRGGQRRTLAAGTVNRGARARIEPLPGVTVRRGDLLSLVIDARDGSHVCDLTAIDLSIREGAGAQREWVLAQDCAGTLGKGNPQADRFGNARVWHFHTGRVEDEGGKDLIPPGSLLAQWLEEDDPARAATLARRIQSLLAQAEPAGLSEADASLHRRLRSLNGPLFGRWKPADLVRQATAADLAATRFGVPRARFGRTPDGREIDEGDLSVQAPSLVELRLPREFAEGWHFVAVGRLHREAGAEGSVQLHAGAQRGDVPSGLLPGTVKESRGPGSWTTATWSVAHDMPVLTHPGSAARRRMEQAFAGFRELFPAALCYTKIVPVDEVVTLTLYHREDDHLRRLMLDDPAAAELDRLWSELHYISQDALKLVDAYEQLWQYATQDADPKVFEPMRQPILDRAAAFRRELTSSEPRHVDAVAAFAGRAWRRPLTAREDEELRMFYRTLRGEELPHDEAVRLLLARVLTAPAFLYRIEEPAPGRDPGRVSGWELATRLSYFLWSTAPDDTLRAAAASGRLQDDEFLAALTRRMLRDDRVRRLAIEFACQWLHIRDFDQFDEKSERHFPEFAGLRGAMYEESIRFFTDLFQNDGSILSLLDADHTFLNEALARHYGLDGVTQNAALGTETDGWWRVAGVKRFSRGGILALATTLSKQSGASRTSPILRGNWVSETLLGEKLPRPPRDVPPLPEEVPQGLSERALIERHASDPACAKCHRRIDPYGFALESFDAIGRRRRQDQNGRPIDTTAALPDGTAIAGLDGLRAYLLGERREDFVRQFCRKLLGYALGRAVRLSDEPLLDDMMARLRVNDHRFSVAVETIVLSRQFREIRGREAAGPD